MQSHHRSLFDLPSANQNCKQTSELADAQLVLMGDPVDTRRVVPHWVSVHLSTTRCMLILFAATPRYKWHKRCHGLLKVSQTGPHPAGFFHLPLSKIF